MYKVLLVEDEEIIRKGLMFAVDWLKAGCVVVGEAMDGEEGLARIEELQPDIVITDVKMPFVDGLQMLERSRGQDYEAIILSGYDEFAYAKKAISLDVTEYLLKPVDFPTLYKTLEKMAQKIEQKRAMRQLKASEKEKAAPLLQLPMQGKSKYTEKLLRRIRKDYAKKLSLQELSEEYGVSSVYLHTKFKQDMHYTFNDFLNRYRIMQAVELLKEGRWKVYEVGEMTGFQDYKYFTAVFKKYVGYAPGKFREASEELREK